MSKKEIKETVITIMVLLLNVFISFIIPYIFNIQNTVVLSSYTMIMDEITYEVLIFMVLIVVEVIICELLYQKTHGK